MKKQHYFLITALAMTLALSLGYFAYRPQANEPETRPSITPAAPVVLTEAAQIEYIYNYKGDGITETALAPIPPYLVGLDETVTREKMPGFEITSFSPEKLTVVKKLDGSSRQHYYLGEKNGYLAVYYKHGGGLKELTNTPISCLSADESDLLFGTEIIGKENLARVLEDIES
ncbi:MAG: hypothetical protein IJ062_04620 [Firmicutes bacterium]|nr:hypothetical protein [Bacillota bacterium]